MRHLNRTIASVAAVIALATAYSPLSEAAVQCPSTDEQTCPNTLEAAAAASNIGTQDAIEIAAAAKDHNNADGLVPAEVEDWVESILSNSALGPYIRQALSALEAPLIGPYQWSGYLPCSIGEPNCGDNMLRLATRSNISFAACTAYEELALMGYVLNPQPHGSSGCTKPYWPAGVTAYTFIGYEQCSGGLFCFAGWRRHDVSPLSYAGCFGMMLASGWRPAPEKSGPQPPLGVCIPEIN